MGWNSLDHRPETVGEVSDVLAGEPPLLVLEGEVPALVVEREPAATAYNVYADTLGSWYSPTPGEGTVCGITSWTDNLDGTVTLDYEAPAGSWVLVTASDDCREGPAGADSSGAERFGIGSWHDCP